MGRSVAGAVVVGLAVTFGGGGSGAAAARSSQDAAAVHAVSRQAIHACGSINFNDGAYASDISERGTTCQEARHLAGSSWSGRPGIHHQDGFMCQDIGAAEDFIATFCTKGSKQVYWNNEA